MWHTFTFHVFEGPGHGLHVKLTLRPQMKFVLTAIRFIVGYLAGLNLAKLNRQLGATDSYKITEEHFIDACLSGKMTEIDIESFEEVIAPSATVRALYLPAPFYVQWEKIDFAVRRSGTAMPGHA